MASDLLSSPFLFFDPMSLPCRHHRRDLRHTRLQRLHTKKREAQLDKYIESTRIRKHTEDRRIRHSHPYVTWPTVALLPHPNPPNSSNLPHSKNPNPPNPRIQIFKHSTPPNAHIFSKRTSVLTSRAFCRSASSNSHLFRLSTSFLTYTRSARIVLCCRCRAQCLAANWVAAASHANANQRAHPFRCRFMSMAARRCFIPSRTTRKTGFRRFSAMRTCRSSLAWRWSETSRRCLM